MALLPILKFPDPRLRTKAEPITEITPELRRFVDDMFETMYDEHGLGLAGTQVNFHKQIFTMDLSESRKEPICVINAQILNKEGSQWDYHGCLSVGGGIADKIERALKLRMRWMDLDGKTHEADMEGLAAICVQHEMDHLNGILFIDHLSKLKQARIRKKLEKMRKE